MGGNANTIFTKKKEIIKNKQKTKKICKFEKTKKT